jgi:MFS family permease
MKTVTTPVLRLFAFRPVLVIASLITAAALAGCALFGRATPEPVIWAVLFVAGCSRSMTFTAINTLMFAEVTPTERAGATALSAMLQQVSFSLGVALAALALNLSLALFKGQALALWDFRVAFAAMAVVSVVAAAGFLRLKSDAGDEVRGRAA